MSHPWSPSSWYRCSFEVIWGLHFLYDNNNKKKAIGLKKEAKQPTTMKSHNILVKQFRLQKLTNYSLLKFVRFHQNQGLPHFLM